MRARVFPRSVAAVAFALLAGTAVADEATVPPPAPPQTMVEQPRAYGHLVGDVLIQRVLLEIDGREAEPVDLPRKEKIGVWLLRRGSRIERGIDGKRWLLIDYQIVNASKDLDNFVLPALHLRTKTAPLILDIPEWPVTVGAITAQVPRNRGTLLLLQPDRPAPLIALAPIRRHLRWSLLGLLATLAAWGSWLAFRNWRASERLPFAIARRELRYLTPDSIDAWRVLHRAFDATAGRVVQPASLPLLFARAPELEEARTQIEQFFALSDARFFSGKAAARADLSIVSLCRQLRGIEKRNER